MSKVRIILKNGAEFVVECESFLVTKNSMTGGIVSYKIEGISKNKPLYIDFTQIAAIVEELS